MKYIAISNKLKVALIEHKQWSTKAVATINSKQAGKAKQQNAVTVVTKLKQS